MSHPTAKSYLKSIPILLSAAVLFFFSSCSVVKDYPVRTPFMYETNIEIGGKFSTDERKQLTNQLGEQLHDSIQVRRVQRLIGWEKGPRLFYTELRRPPVFDSLNADKSLTYMRALLNSLGYFRDTLSFQTKIDTVGSQYRTVVNFEVHPGKLILLDSIRYYLNSDSLEYNDTLAYNLGNDTLQAITENSLKESLLKKGEPFAKPLISSEFSRLVDVYRNNGYFRFSFDDLVAVWDTVGLALLRPTLDPFEQAAQLEELQRRKANPTAALEIRLRAKDDTSHLTRFYIGNVTVYPDLTVDTSRYTPMETYARDFKIVSYYDLFKPRAITENIYLRKGALYSQRNYLRTLNRFNAVGAWRLVSIDQLPRPGTDTVDMVVKLTPSSKYLFDFNVEGSKNWGNPLITGDLGIATNVGLQNRNFARMANQSATNLRYGIELNVSDELLQTQQVSISHNITFPRFVPRIASLPLRFRSNTKTILSMNVGNTDRRDFFNLTTFNTSWGYQYNWRNKLFEIRIPNVEYNFVNNRKLLDDLISKNASYRYIFNKGLVVSTVASYSVTNARKGSTDLFRVNLEGSGLLGGFVKNNKFLNENLYRFLKLNAEFKQAYKICRKEFAWRILAGGGLGMPRSNMPRNEEDTLNFYLPFFRQYYGGGSNSMRAWGLRKLGPGSTIKAFDRTVAPDRFGDIQLEMNAEYRFFLADMNGVTINSALYTDIGNIWFLRDNPDFPDGQFKFNKLWKDLAIGMGTGLRIDFGLFLIRLDYAYKVKDPSPDAAHAAFQNKWFYNWKMLNGQFQLGVNYPF